MEGTISVNNWHTVTPTVLCIVTQVDIQCDKLARVNIICVIRLNICNVILDKHTDRGIDTQRGANQCKQLAHGNSHCAVHSYTGDIQCEKLAHQHDHPRSTV